LRWVYSEQYPSSGRNTVAYSLKARTVESQQPEVTRQRLLNNKGICFLRSPCLWLRTQQWIHHAIAKQQLHRSRGTVFCQSDNCCGSVVVSCCCEKLVAEAEDSSGTQRTGDVRRWKLLPSNGYWRLQQTERTWCVLYWFVKCVELWEHSPCL
jgi:hypothetical protein